MDSATKDQQFLARAVEATVRIGLLLALVAWCFEILRPFIIPMAWAVIIAVAVHPPYARLREALGGKARSAAGLLVAAALLLLIGPTAMLGGTIADGAALLAEGVKAGSIRLPVPPEGVRDWPIIGERLHAQWVSATSDLEQYLQPFTPQLLALGRAIVSTAASAGFVFLQTLLSIVIAGVLLAHDTGGDRAAQSIASRLAGERGAEFARLATATVRSVAQGILGVALIQSALAGLGFLLIGVPGAGLWALLGMVFCIIQIGLLPVTLPILIYVWATSTTLPAILFTIWIVFVSVIDNFLKPMLLGRGVQVPMIVIFLGSIGGFLSAGIIGLFVGSVVLVLGYTLISAWVDSPRAAEAAGPESAA